MGSAAILIGLVLYAATLYVIRSWITRMPSKLWAVARDELARARAEEDDKATKALQEAADKRVGALVKGVRDYHDDIAALFRRQVADAEVRARVAERHAVDTAVALEAASALLANVRATHEGLGELPPVVAELRAILGEAGFTKPVPQPLADDDTRKTVEMTSSSSSAPANAGDEQRQSWDANEETKVMTAPLRVPQRRPPPVPRTPLPPALEEEPHEKDQHGSVLPPVPEEKKP